MKRTLVFLVAILLVVATVLTSCSKVPADSDTTETEATGETINNGDVTTEESNNESDHVETTEPFVEESPYLATEALLDASVSEELYNEFLNNKRTTYVLPKEAEIAYVMGSVNIINDCRLLSVTFPVWKTLKPDEDGNFVFTLHVFGSGFEALHTEAKRSYQIKVNAEEFGLAAGKSSARKLVKIDLTPYDITLAEDETIGYYSKDDTIFAPILFNNTKWNSIDNNNTAFQVLREKAPYVTGTYINVGTTELNYSHNTLMLDFEWEKTYEKKSEYLAMKNNTEYNSMVEALIEKYKGKYVSVVGDST